MHDLDAAAADQLADQILAQLWAVRAFDARLCGAVDAASAELIRQRAECIVTDVRQGRCSVELVLRLVQPVGRAEPADPWWTTPLGRLLRAAGLDRSGTMPGERGIRGPAEPRGRDGQEAPRMAASASSGPAHQDGRLASS